MLVSGNTLGSAEVMGQQVESSSQQTELVMVCGHCVCFSALCALQMATQAMNTHTKHVTSVTARDRFTLALRKTMFVMIANDCQLHNRA